MTTTTTCALFRLLPFVFAGFSLAFLPMKFQASSVMRKRFNLNTYMAEPGDGDYNVSSDKKHDDGQIPILQYRVGTYEHIEMLISNGFNAMEVRQEKFETSLNQKFAAMEVRQENFETNFNQKFANVESNLIQKIANVESNLNQKFANVESNLNQKIANVESNLNQKFAAMENNVNEKFANVESNLDRKFAHVETKLDRIESKIDKVDKEIILILLCLAVIGGFGLNALYPILDKIAASM
jgi:hypothetical protein